MYYLVAVPSVNIYLAYIFTNVKQFLLAKLKDVVNKIRQNLYQWHKYKVSLCQHGMGQGQRFILIDQIIKVDDVDVHGAVAPTKLPGSAQFIFYGLGGLKQIFG